MKRKKEYIVEGLEIIDAGSEGKAVGKHEGLTLFVPFAVPGDVVDVRVYKQRKGYAEAELLSVRRPSPFRVKPVCAHFGLCGGCKWQSMSYDKQLEYKQKQVLDNFTRLGKFDFPSIDPIIPSPREFYYRNKLEFTFTNRRWLEAGDDAARKTGELDTRGIGFHIPGKFDKVLHIRHCYLQADPSNAIRLAVFDYAVAHGLTFHNAREHDGLLRNLLIRNSSTGEVMVVVVFGEPSDSIFPLLDFVAETFPQITSLHYVVNTKLNDSISDQEIIRYKGSPCIEETMEGLSFKIGPVSFYQTNGEQAYKLYEVVREFARITENDLVYDLYTGTGTIAHFVAKQARKVVGIEYVEAAIEDAWMNSRNNHIGNTAFYAGDMAKVLTLGFVEENGKPDIVITDPPRAGMHPKVIEQLLAIAPQRIVYVSCNPATQARDLTLLAEKYAVKRIQPVDMFPHTQHVENVVLLELSQIVHSALIHRKITCFL